MKIIFWSVILLWWIIDIYFLLVKKTGYTKVLDKKSKFIVTILILIGVILAIIPKGFRITWLKRPFGLCQISGTILIVIGIIIRLFSILTLGEHFSADIVIKKKELVKKGLYRWIRHPTYTGEMISFIGLGIVFQYFPSSFFVVILPLSAFIYRALFEERKLLSEFGSEYLQYKKRTRMFI